MKSKLTLVTLLFPSIVFAHDFIYTIGPGSLAAAQQEVMNNPQQALGGIIATGVVNSLQIVGCSTGGLSGCPGTTGAPTQSQVAGGIELAVPSLAIAGVVTGANTVGGGVAAGATAVATGGAAVPLIAAQGVGGVVTGANVVGGGVVTGANVVGGGVVTGANTVGGGVMQGVGGVVTGGNIVGGGVMQGVGGVVTGGNIVGGGVMQGVAAVVTGVNIVGGGILEVGTGIVGVYNGFLLSEKVMDQNLSGGPGGNPFLYFTLVGGQAYFGMELFGGWLLGGLF